MCGIFGSTSVLSDKALSSIQSLLNHRGPDSNGLARLPLLARSTPLTFYHSRLAIQDLSAAGHQPMQSQCGRWWLTFNGEIYNHYEMRKSLNVSFKGTSDTETLVEYLAA